MQKISWKDAIAEMRKLTKLNKPFSFAHATFDSSTGKSHGIKRVDSALLRSSLPDDVYNNVDPDFLLPYKITDTNEMRQCYKCLIIEFDGKEVILD